MALNSSAADASSEGGKNGTSEPKHPGLALLVVGSFGVIYGDIGTSPLYAIREAAKAALPPDRPPSWAAMVGILSLMLWALILIVSLKYVTLLLRADNNGEGGTLSLMALARRGLRGKRSGWVLLLGMIGAALFYADATITPAISVLAAVEGITVRAPNSGARRRADGARHPRRAVRHPAHGHGARLGFLRADNRALVPRDGRCGSIRPDAGALGAPGDQSLLCRKLPDRPQAGGLRHDGCGLPRGHRCGGDLCRPRPFRTEAHPHRLVRTGAAGADAQLFRTDGADPP